jgi:hypothetical protein
MLLLAAAALAASPPPSASPQQPTSAVVQARATVRIVSAARLHWEEHRRDGDVPVPRKTTIQTLNGPQPAKLIEFE